MQINIDSNQLNFRSTYETSTIGIIFTLLVCFASQRDPHALAEPQREPDDDGERGQCDERHVRVDREQDHDDEHERDTRFGGRKQECGLHLDEDQAASLDSSRL